MSVSSKIGFSLKDIATLQFAIIEEAFNEKEMVKVNLNSRFVVHKEENAVSSIFKVQFTQKKTPFLILETGCHFEISSEAWEEFLDEERKALNLSKGFAGHLLMLNIGTARGVLHSKTEGTLYNQFILPPINVTKLITEDVIINLTEDLSDS